MSMLTHIRKEKQKYMRFFASILCKIHVMHLLQQRQHNDECYFIIINWRPIRLLKNTLRKFDLATLCLRGAVNLIITLSLIIRWNSFTRYTRRNSKLELSSQICFLLIVFLERLRFFCSLIL